MKDTKGSMKWISMRNKQPFPMHRVIATDGITVDFAGFDMVNWYSCDSEGRSELSMNDITHWMSVPEPPQEGK